MQIPQQREQRRRHGDKLGSGCYFDECAVKIEIQGIGRLQCGKHAATITKSMARLYLRSPLFVGHPGIVITLQPENRTITAQFSQPPHYKQRRALTVFNRFVDAVGWHDYC